FNLAQSRVKSYECPADQPTAYQSVRGTFVVFYCDATTLTLTGGYYPNPTGQLFGRSNYAGCAGSIGPGTNQFYGKWYGIMTDQSATTLAGVTAADGTANTFLFGELLGGEENSPRNFSASWMGCGMFPTAWALIQPAQWYSFGSKHTAVVQFAMGDGSVRKVRKGVGANGGGTNWFAQDWYVFQEAGGFADGGTRDQ